MKQLTSSSFTDYRIDHKATPGYVPKSLEGGATELVLSAANGDFTMQWFNPRAGGPLKSAGATVSGESKCTLTATARTGSPSCADRKPRLLDK